MSNLLTNLERIVLALLVGCYLALITLQTEVSLFQGAFPFADAGRFFLVSLLSVIIVTSIGWPSKVIAAIGLLAVFGQTAWSNIERGELLLWWMGLLGVTVALSIAMAIVSRIRGWRFQRVELMQRYDQSQFSILGLILLTTASAGLVSLMKFLADLPFESRWVSHFIVVPLGFSLTLMWGLSVFLGKAPRWVYMPFFCILVPLWGLLVPVAFDRSDDDYFFMAVLMTAHMLHIIATFSVLRSAGYRFLRRSIVRKASLTSKPRSATADSSTQSTPSSAGVSLEVNACNTGRP